MKNYCIKSNPGLSEFLTIIKENDAGYFIRIVREYDGYERVIEDFMTKDLFESCLRTGYIAEIKEATSVVA